MLSLIVTSDLFASPAVNSLNELGNFTSGLVAYYPFAGNGNDYSENGNNIPLNSGFIFSTNRFGYRNSAIFYSSITSCASSVKNIGISGNSDRSVSFWVFDTNPVLPFGNGRNADGFNCVLFTFGRGNNVGQYGGFSQFQLRSDCDGWTGSGIVIGSGYADVYSLCSSNANNPFYNQWHHITYVYSGSVNGSQIYFDGQMQSSLLWWGNKTNALNTIDSPLVLGASGDPGSLQGVSISDLRIYNRALSSNEVVSMYNYEKSQQAFILNDVSISAKGILQGSSTNRLGITVTSPLKLVSINTPQILSWLAYDENKNGKYSRTSFPGGSKLVAVVSVTDNTVMAFQVIDKKNNLLVDVSDILSFSMDGRSAANISTGRVSVSSGLASPSASYFYISTLTFDDTAINGGKNIKFYLSGIGNNQINDTVPALRTSIYKETHTFNMSGYGDGSYLGAPMLISGSCSAFGSATFTLQ